MRFMLTEKNAVNAYGLIPNREKYYALKDAEEKAIKYEYTREVLRCQAL